MEEPNGHGAEYVASVVQCPDMIKPGGQPAARNERNDESQQSLRPHSANARRYLKLTALKKAEPRRESTLDADNRRNHTQIVPFSVNVVMINATRGVPARNLSFAAVYHGGHMCMPDMAMGGVKEVTGVEAAKCNHSRDSSGRASGRDRRERRVRSRGPGSTGCPGTDRQADRGPAHHYRAAVREPGVRGPGHLGGIARSPAATGCRPRQLCRSSNRCSGHKPAGSAAADEATARRHS